MATLEQTLALCITKGHNVLSKMRETSFSPDSKKVLTKRYSLKETSEMVGVTTEAIRKAEKEDRIPKLGASDGSKKREFSISDVNKLRDYFKTRPSKGKDGETCITSFINFKGGVYKSTASLHFAQHMAKKGFKVLFVDADSQGTSTHFFGYTPDDEQEGLETLRDCLLGETTDLRQAIIGTPWDGLDLIPANLSLYDAELMVPMRVATKDMAGAFFLNLRKSLDLIKDSYDVIVIDAPPSLGIINMNVVYASDALIIPSPPLFADFASTLQFFTMLKDVASRIAGEREYKFIKLLITKYDGTEEAKAFVRVIKHVFGQNLVAQNLFSSTVEIPRASQDLKTIYEVTDMKVKKTYDRALLIVDKVNLELENMVKATWPQYSDALIEEGVMI
jgi:chromosome partitioning protein